MSIRVAFASALALAFASALSLPGEKTQIERGATDLQRASRAPTRVSLFAT